MEMLPDGWSVILPGVIAAVGFAALAIRADPPAPNVAANCATVAAVLLAFKMVAMVARSRSAPGREARLITFVAFAAIVMGWFGAERAIADAAFTYKVDAQSAALVTSARDLSRELLAFVESRRRSAPPRPRPASWDDDEANWFRFESETAIEYNRRFGARVRVAHGLLTLRSVRDPDFDTFYRLPANDFQMEIVGQRLSSLADRLARQH
jgi:hypothetical protein